MKNPLVQFLLLGALVYGLYLVSGAAEDAEDVILVTRDELLTFMQFRARDFDEARALRAWHVMQPEDRQRLVDDYVRDEALYREALALGLDADDYVIRQRLIQKVEFLHQDDDPRSDEQLDEQQLDRYFKQNLERYRLPASVTFTHVFFRGDVDVSEVLAGLGGQTPADALVLGERFPYHRNYSDSSQAEVRAHFGEAFANEIFEVPLNTWRGPLRSAYGTHLVYLQRRTDSRLPALSEIREQVVADASRELAEQQLEKAAAGIVSQFEVRVADDVTQP